jgi:arylamine N-acetyltransferase
LARVHVVNIITLPTGEKYVSDVSFGGDGPTKPIPLISGTILQNLGTQEIRLIHDNIPCQQNAEPKFWIYQYRNSVDKEWNSFYAFPEMEFFINDFQIMNYFTSNFVGGTNFQTERVLVVRFLKGDGEEDGIVEKVMLVDGEVKRNHGGSTRVERVCGSEEERLEALKEVFGIRLVEEEVLGIRGTITELLGTKMGA